jgi:hypothetical protein
MDILVDTPFAIRVEVFDGSFTLPVMQDVPSDGLSGRGLRLVEAIATCWGARQRVDGKVVWCEQAIPGADHGTADRPASWPGEDLHRVKDSA